MRRLLVNSTNITADTRYAPDANGISMPETPGHRAFVQFVVSGGATVTVEQCVEEASKNASAWTDQWEDVTGQCVDVSAGSSADSYVDTHKILEVPCNGRIRVKYVTSDGSNAVRISVEVL